MTEQTLTEAEIGYLIRKGEISVDDLRDTEASPPEPEDTTLKDGLAAIAEALSAIKFPAPPQIGLPAPQVTVNVPKHERCEMIATVLERDKHGNIQQVSLRRVDET